MIDVTSMVMQQKTVVSIWELQILAECSKYNKIVIKNPELLEEFFAISGVEASQSDSLVRGICSILGTQLSVLFDYGEIHSFISFDCAKKLKLPIRELEFELVVSTPTKGIVVTSSMCAECPVIIDGRRYKINMICIPVSYTHLTLPRIERCRSRWSPYH